MKYSILGNPSEFGLRAIGWSQGNEGKASKKQAQAWSREILREATDKVMHKYNKHLDKNYGRDDQPVVGRSEQIEYSNPPIQQPKKKRPKKPSPRRRSIAERRKALRGSLATLREQNPNAPITLMLPKQDKDE